MIAFLGASLKREVDVVAEAVQLEKHVFFRSFGDTDRCFSIDGLTIDLPFAGEGSRIIEVD